MKYELLKNLYYKDKAAYECEYVKRFNSDCAFHLDMVISRNPAFFLMTPDLFEQIFRIQKMDAVLSILCKELPPVAIKQYLRKSLIGEIVGTNDIEQVHSSRKEIGEALNAAERKTKGNRFKDITNRYNLLGQEEYVLKSCADIRRIYDDLLYEEIKSEDPNDLPDGEIFRKSSVDVCTGTDKIVHTGILPEKEIIEYMNKALDFLNSENINIFFRMAVFHYLFGYIHPFYEGNGRMSRFISSALLYKSLFTQLVAYRLSGAIKNKKGQYYKAFDTCNNPKNKGDITPFVYMFFDVIIEAMDCLKQSLSGKKDILNYYGKRIKFLPNASNTNVSYIYELLLQAALFSENGICKDEMCAVLKISRGAVDNQFKKISPEYVDTVLFERTKYHKLNLEKFDKIIDEHQ